MRTYQRGNEARFFEVMGLAGWPGWDEAKLKLWLHRMLPHGWFMVVIEADDLIVATAMATHDHTWERPFSGDPARKGVDWERPFSPELWPTLPF